MPVDVALTGVAVLIVAALMAPVPAPGRARPLVYGLSAAACTLLLVTAGRVLLGSDALPEPRVLPLGIPWIGVHLRIDALAAAFLVLIDLGGLVTSLHALGYGRHETRPGRVLPFYPLFLAGMNLVVLAGDAFSFLFSWEFMSLASWALVTAHHHEADNRRAGVVYLVMASFGTLMLILAFGLLAGPDGVFAFEDMAKVVRPDWATVAILAAALLGAGSKAGLVPLHVWLPLAHPAAPSHVSALMSGVMTKVAVYGFLRIVFDLLGPPAWWWSLPVIGMGAGTAVLGVLQAVLQSDIKRILAFSTVENIGIVFIGLGLALAFEANGMTAPAALAVTAALFHALNHSLFKSLLFFGAGAVVHATGARDIERLGGLIHRMPATAIVMLGGALAISALPPLNGFASEWLLFQAVLLSPDLPQWGLKFLVPAAGAMLALAAALSATCFVRLYGIAFLGRPRSPAAAEAHDTDRISLATMGALLVLCLAAGTLPGLVIDALAPVAVELVGRDMPTQPLWPTLAIVPVSESRSSYSGLLVFVFIAMSAFLAAGFIHRFASRAFRRAPAWDCGFPDASPATQYTADSFAQPLRRVFGPIVFRSRLRHTMPEPGDAAPARLEVEVHDLVWEGIYTPIRSIVRVIADRLDVIQFLSIRAYLGFVFVALVGLLVVAAAWG